MTRRAPDHRMTRAFFIGWTVAAAGQRPLSSGEQATVDPFDTARASVVHSDGIARLQSRLGRACSRPWIGARRESAGR
jgi:hypothetical protein